MILSHRHKFIFLKTQKTGGTSLELALSRFCGPDDVVTHVTAEDEEKRKLLGGRGPQNEVVPFARRRMRDHVARLRSGRPTRFYNHVPARLARGWIDHDTWNEYYKFSIERNPWDRAVSFYWWRTRHAEVQPDVTEFLQHAKDTDLSNFHIYSVGGRVAADHVIRYENLDDELVLLAERIGLPEVPELPRAKAGYRKDRRPYEEVLGAEARERVAAVCRREIDFMGYQFERERSNG